MNINSRLQETSVVFSGTNEEDEPLLSNDASADTNSPDDDSLIIKVEEGTSTWYVSVFIVINAVLGAGMLNFPLAFHQSGGILTSIICQVVLVSLLIGSLIVFVRCAGKFNSASYQDVVTSFCGQKVSFLCSFFIFLYTFGSSVTFLIIIGDQLEKFLQAACPDLITQNLWYIDRKFLVTLVSVFVVLPLCYSKKIDFLKYPSYVGVLAVVYCVFLIVIKYFTGVDGAKVGPIRTRPVNIADVFLVIPTICFSYQCHLSIVPIYTCTKNRETKCFDKTIIISIIACFAIYNAFAIFGYLTFGSCVQSDILLSYKATPEVLAAVIGMAIKMVVSYPLLHFVGRKVVDDLWLKLVKRNKNDVRDDVSVRRNERIRRIFITTIWFLAALLISLFVPDIGKVINYLGGLAAIFIFIFPGICFLEYVLKKTDTSNFYHWSGILFAALCILIGGFVLGVTTTSNIMNGLHSEPTPLTCL